MSAVGCALSKAQNGCAPKERGARSNNYWEEHKTEPPAWEADGSVVMGRGGINR